MLSDGEKVRIRYHMGYPNLSAGPSLSAGVPLDSPLMTLLERSFVLLLPAAEPLVRELVARLDMIDGAIVDAQIRMQASKVDGIELNANETNMLEGEYMRQVARLSDTLHCTIYPFSARFKALQSLGGKIQTGMIGVA